MSDGKMKWFKTILRILLGLFFVSTAVMKLFSLDNFEIYIFTFKIFSFNFASLMARVIIAAEFVLGVFLIAKIFYKQTWWLTLLMLIGFTCLLIYTAIFRHDANCHCFGDVVELNPTWSIVKNLVTIGLLFLVKNEEDYRFRARTFVMLLTFGVAFIVPFILLTPDAVYRKIFTQSGAAFNEKLFEDAVADTVLYQTLYDIRRIEREETDTVVFSLKDTVPDFLAGRKVVGILSSACTYCKASTTKLHTAFERNHLDESQLQILIWGNEGSVARFIETTHTENANFRRISPFLALDLVEGKFPTFVLMEDGKPLKVWDYRAVNENELVDFLTATP